MMGLWRQPSRSERRRTGAGRPASTAWPYTQRCSAAVLLLVDGTESPVSRACRIHTDQVHRAGGARDAESTLNQQQHPGRPPRGGRVVGRLSAPRVPHHHRFAREHCPACTFGTPLGARQAVVFACHELSVRERCSTFWRITRGRKYTCKAARCKAVRVEASRAIPWLPC